MNAKAFFVASLQSALDLGIATHEDVLKHVTAEILANHLPRPLWARLFTACLGAPKVDAQLVIETIGVPNLCEHVPAHLIWMCLAEVANRSLGRKAEDEPILLQPKTGTLSNPLATPPPPEVITKPANPPLAPLPKLGPAPTQAALADIVAELEAETASDRPAATPATTSPRATRVPTQQRFRQSQTNSGVGRLAQPASAPPATTGRRPQAAASLSRSARRGETDVEDAEAETSVGSKDEWRNTIAVDDDQLVDWQASEETLTVTDDITDSRKR